MNRTIDKRLNALEDRLLKPAIVTPLCLDGFDIDEYQRLMIEFVSHDGWVEQMTALFRAAGFTRHEIH